MTTRDRALSATRGAALTRCLALSRSGDVISGDDTLALARCLSGQLGIRTAGPAGPITVHTNGGAVVVFTPIFTGYAVRVAASPI